MKKLFCSIMIFIFSFLTPALRVQAAPSNYYVSASVAISSLLTAYGYLNSDVNRKLAEKVAEGVVAASDAGYTVSRNGIESVGIAISDGVSYISKSFAEWVYNWTISENMADLSIGESISFPVVNADNTYTYVPFSGSWSNFALSAGIPQVVIDEIYNVYNSNSSVFDVSLSNSKAHVFYVTHYPNRTDFNYVFRFGFGSPSVSNSEFIPYASTLGSSITNDGTVNVYTLGVFAHDNNFRTQPCIQVRCKSTDSGVSIYDSYVNIQLTYLVGKYVSNNGNFVGFSTINAVLSNTVQDGWTTTGDVPVRDTPIDDYAPTWTGRVKEVPIDGTNTDGLPLTIPIDNVGSGVLTTVPAADVISGTASAVDAALDLPQSIARGGYISTPAYEELEEATTANDNAITLEDAQPIASDFVGWGIDYVKPHLSDVFKKYPFSIPYDMYLILNSVYSGSTVRTRSLNSVSFRSRSNDPTDMNPSNVGIILDFNYVERDPASYADPNAPKFDYDFNVTAFGKNYHFIGTFDFAPYGWLFQLMKVGIGIIWIAGLLNYNIQSIRGKNK